MFRTRFSSGLKNAWQEQKEKKGLYPNFTNAEKEEKKCFLGRGELQKPPVFARPRETKFGADSQLR